MKKGKPDMLRYKERYDYANSEFDAVQCKLSNLISPDSGVQVISADEGYVNRALDQPLGFEKFIALKNMVKYVGVTQEFKEIIDFFKTPAGETPAGFRIEYNLDPDLVLRVNLLRDISYEKNGVKRPTNVLFSADSANPYEVDSIKSIIANLTCNPQLVYDWFLNDPKVNIGNKFKTREEVMTELARVLGPGVDISVELNNPFADESEILEEAAQFKEILSKYRVVIKVPHTGPVNGENIKELLEGDKKFKRMYDSGATSDFLRGHNIAILLKDHGYRVNFTLMFEPHQVGLALQARPYFINTFYKFRLFQDRIFKEYLSCFEVTQETEYLKKLRDYMFEKDYLTPEEKELDLMEVKKRAEYFLSYRVFDDPEGSDGLDQARHALRYLRQSNLPDTRLIICSMEAELYSMVDKMLMEEEFRDMTHRVVITTAPNYLASQVCAPGMIHYHREFMRAAGS